MGCNALIKKKVQKCLRNYLKSVLKMILKKNLFAEHNSEIWLNYDFDN